MYKRPNSKETETDILRMQKEFMKQKAENKIKPAATLVNTNKENEDDESTTASDTDTPMVGIKEQLANTFEAIPKDINLGNIVEKHAEVKATELMFCKSLGFPQAKRRDPNISGSQGSIFSLQMRRLKKQETPIETQNSSLRDHSLKVTEETDASPISFNSNKRKITLPHKSNILTGTESKRIHDENVRLLKNMTEEEILEEREKLISTMDPALIAFLKSRHKKQKVDNKTPTIKEQNEASENMNIEEIETPSEILSQPTAEKWLHFDVVEANKLSWMKDVNLSKIEKDKQFEARFDFEGWLLPYSEFDVTEKSRILYHHGEEAGRPGYTLQELFQLARSSVIQQKITALNCIANILSLQSTGVYDDIIEIPLEQIFFVVRFCLDDNTPSVLNASIKALRNLIFSQVDETCLDSLLGFALGQVQPIMPIDNENEDDNTVNDQQLVETNLLKCLARTDILIRIRYILNTVQPSVETVVYCLEILIRLARDSRFILEKLCTCENLLGSIIKLFLPISPNSSNSDYTVPLIQAVKLLRILSSRDRNVANDMVNKYKVMESVAAYLSNETYSQNATGLKLQIESFHLWSLFIHYNFTVEFVHILQPVLFGILEYHCQNTELELKTTYVRQGHLSALLVLFGKIAEKDFGFISTHFSVLFDKGFRKWTTQFSHLTDYMCGKLQIISSLFYCISMFIKHTPNDAGLPCKIFDTAASNIIESKAFAIVTDRIINGSMLLNNYETHKTSSNLKSLEASAWYTAEHVVPILQTKSSFTFLCSMSGYVVETADYEIKLNFLYHYNVLKYLQALRSSEKYFLTSNWFTRIESQFLLNLLKCSITVQKDIDTSIFYDLAVKCLSVFTIEQKPDVERILNEIIFCPKYYPSEVLMQNLDVAGRTDGLEVSLNNLDEILHVYTEVLGLRNNVPDFASNCCLDIAIGNVIPVDWIYTPIIALYSNQQQNKDSLTESQQIFIIKNCLRWIVIYETHFPVLALSINPTDRFCRIACVFLGSDSLFLNREIHGLLEHSLKNIISKCENELNFNKEIQGLNSFQDFYTQLLEQYQGVSYGDILFGNFLLVPLAQRHNIQFKKTLWSEYMGVVQIFNVAPEQTLCSLESFLNPPEEDMSLLKCYRRAIVNDSIRKRSVLFKIAEHHVNGFITRRNKH